MSRKINVNPGQYKTKGRERQGEDVVHEPERARFALAERRGSRRAGRRPWPGRHASEPDAAVRASRLFTGR